jgi:hypothetical protein
VVNGACRYVVKLIQDKYNPTMTDVAPITPTLNGGSLKLRCGCAYTTAELDEKGNKKVLLRHENRGFFKPLGSDAGMYITVCAQCGAIEQFGILLPDINSSGPAQITLT